MATRWNEYIKATEVILKEVFNGIDVITQEILHWLFFNKGKCETAEDVEQCSQVPVPKCTQL